MSGVIGVQERAAGELAGLTGFFKDWESSVSKSLRDVDTNGDGTVS